MKTSVEHNRAINQKLLALRKRYDKILSKYHAEYETKRDALRGKLHATQTR